MADPAVERTLPHNLEAERSVLGAILIDPVTAIAAVSWKAIAALIFVVALPTIFCHWAFFMVVQMFPANVAALAGNGGRPRAAVFHSGNCLGRDFEPFWLAGDDNGERIGVEQPCRHPLHVGEADGADLGAAALDIVDAKPAHLDFAVAPGFENDGIGQTHPISPMIGDKSHPLTDPNGLRSSHFKIARPARAESAPDHGALQA